MTLIILVTLLSAAVQSETVSDVERRLSMVEDDNREIKGALKQLIMTVCKFDYKYLQMLIYILYFEANFEALCSSNALNMYDISKKHS